MPLGICGGLPAAEPAGPRWLVGSHLDTFSTPELTTGFSGCMPLFLEGLGDEASLRNRSGRLLGGRRSRFGTPFIGSRALVGRLDEDLLAERIRGRFRAGAIEDFGLNPC